MAVAKLSPFTHAEIVKSALDPVGITAAGADKYSVLATSKSAPLLIIPVPEGVVLTSVKSLLFAVSSTRVTAPEPSEDSSNFQYEIMLSMSAILFI